MVELPQQRRHAVARVEEAETGRAPVEPRELRVLIEPDRLAAYGVDVQELRRLLNLMHIDRLKQLDKPIDRSAQSRPANSSENMRADFAASHHTETPSAENKPCTP